MSPLWSDPGELRCSAGDVGREGGKEGGEEEREGEEEGEKGKEKERKRGEGKEGKGMGGGKKGIRHYTSPALPHSPPYTQFAGLSPSLSHCSFSPLSFMSLFLTFPS